MQFSQVASQEARSFREWLSSLMDAFMVRGLHILMQWMLDLRTYGLKVHYNSPRAMWNGQDGTKYYISRCISRRGTFAILCMSLSAHRSA